MSRRTRNIQFFGTMAEVQSILADLAERGLFLFTVENEALVALEPGEGVGGRRVFVGEERQVAASGHREPARHGLVIIDAPSQADGRLSMTVVSAVNGWIDNGTGVFDDRAIRLFEQVRRLFAKLFVGYVDVVARSTGMSRLVTSIRITQGATVLSTSGMELVQRGVKGTRFVAHEVEVDGAVRRPE